MGKDVEVDKDLAGEIDRSVEQAVKASAESRSKPPPPLPEEKLPAAEQYDEDLIVAADAGGAAKPPEGIGDDLVERAIKAGMTMKEVKQYPNPGLLTIACSRMEGSAKNKPDSGSSQPGAAEKEGEAEDPLAGIPDLDPEVYDEKIVSGFKALKGLIRQQQETIKSMRGGQESDWFTSQVDGLGVGPALKADPAKLEALKAKFNVLTAGYKAAKQDVDRGTVFGEAASLTVASEIAAAEAESKKAKLEKRSGQQIARPSGHRQQTKGDALADVAEELDRRFFDKK